MSILQFKILAQNLIADWIAIGQDSVYGKNILVPSLLFTRIVRRVKMSFLSCKLEPTYSLMSGEELIFKVRACIHDAVRSVIHFLEVI